MTNIKHQERGMTNPKPCPSHPADAVEDALNSIAGALDTELGEPEEALAKVRIVRDRITCLTTDLSAAREQIVALEYGHAATVRDTVLTASSRVVNAREVEKLRAELTLREAIDILSRRSDRGGFHGKAAQDAAEALASYLRLDLRHRQGG